MAPSEFEALAEGVVFLKTHPLKLEITSVQNNSSSPLSPEKRTPSSVLSVLPPVPPPPSSPPSQLALEDACAPCSPPASAASTPHTPVRPEPSNSEQGNQITSLVQRAEEIQTQRPSRRRLQKLQQDAKVIVARAGLDFNTTFQQAHKGTNYQGHWSTFLLNVMGEVDLTCGICMRLKLEKNITCQVSNGMAELPSSTSERPPLAIRDIVEPTPLQLLLPEVRTTRGRPSKQASSPKFDVREFLKEHGSDVYEFLSAETLLPHLDETSRDPRTVDEVMQECPILCKLCNVFFTANRPNTRK